MGCSMCSHLIKAGHSLTVLNCTLSKDQPLLDMDASLSHSPQEVATQSDAIFSIVSYPFDVRRGLFDLDTDILIDMITFEPSLAEGISSAASAKSYSSTNTPVFSGDHGAKNGTLAILAGGDEAVTRRLNPLFILMGKVNYMGLSGKGQFAKLANQITIASTMVGLVERTGYAHKAGQNVALFLEGISSGAVGSKSLDLYGAMTGSPRLPCRLLHAL